MRLIVEEGYNRGQEFPVAPGVAIGRGEDCAIQLLSEGVSRRHAEIVERDAALRLRDLKSRNGTRLNGVPIRESALLSGDRIAIGEVRLLFVEEATEEAVAPTRLSERPTASWTELIARPAAPERPRTGPDRRSILGSSPALKKLLARLERAAASEAPVLITGESGCGKELIARGVHDLSARRRRPFVVINSAALAENLLESELFGHEKGAFTGALAKKVGLAEAADGGSLFLDELAELSPSAQAKLLRFLENGEVRPVGATRGRRVDVRIVAATHRDLDAAVSEGAFRQDLLFRLRVAELAVPPLRDRPEDISALAEAFAAEVSKGRKRLSDEALAALASYAWPGNVRELRNAVESAVIFAPGASIERADLPPRLLGEAPASDRSLHHRSLPTLKEAERAAIAQALARCDGQRTRTAEVLGIDRKTLYNKIKEYEL